MASVTDSDDMVSKSNQRVEYFKRRLVSYLSMHVPSLPIIMIGTLPIFAVVFFFLLVSQVIFSLISPGGRYFYMSSSFKWRVRTYD